MLSVTGIASILTTPPVRDFLVGFGASASWDIVKKVASKYKRDSIEGQIWCLLSDTMDQFYKQFNHEFGKQLEYDEEIVITSFLEQLEQNKDSINENSLRHIVEETIYGEMDKLTDQEYKLWVSIFVDNCSKYPNLYQIYKVQEDIKTKVFSERDLILQKIETKLNIYVGNEDHTKEWFQPIIKKLHALFDASWKNYILDLLYKLPKDVTIQEKIQEKMNLIDANEDCEVVLSVLERLFNLHDLTKAPYELVQNLKDCFRYPHFNKVLIVTGTAGAGKSFFLKEYIKTVVSKIEKDDISILTCLVDISKMRNFQNFEDFVINELSCFTGKEYKSICEANKFFEDLQAKLCFVIDDVNSQILQKEDWNKLIQGIKTFSRFEQFRWLLSIDEYEYYYLEWDKSFLVNYCITKTSILHSENQGITMFSNAFSINQYNKEHRIVEWILNSQYGMDEQLFSSGMFWGITTPKEAHYFGEAAPNEEMKGLPSTYYEYINKIVCWKNTALTQQNDEGYENDLQTIIEFIIAHHICELDGLNLGKTDLIPLRRVQLVSPSFSKSTSMFDLDQGIIKVSYRIKIMPFWAAKMSQMIDISNPQNVGDLVLYPKELSEWLIPCVIFFYFRTYTQEGDNLFEFFRVLNEQHILDYALFCAHRASLDFSKKLFEYLANNAICYTQGAKECYSVLYFVFYSQLKTAEKFRLLNAIAEFIPKYGFEKLYERVFCSIIDTSKTEKNLKKNVLEVASCKIDTVNYINGSNAGSKYLELAWNQEKELETIVWDIIEYIESYPKLLPSITKEGNNTSFMDYFIRRCFEKYFFKKRDSILHVYQQLENIFRLEAPLGSYVKRNLTCAAGNVFVNLIDEEYKKNYISLCRTFSGEDDLYQRLTALFLITNSVDETAPNLNEQLASILAELSHDQAIYSKHGDEIDALLRKD